jgi:predicted acylesterase/phospholipase RssA
MDPRSAQAAPESPRPCATPFESIALLLQGGGALGAYRAGVYERLHEAGIEPTCGTYTQTGVRSANPSNLNLNHKLVSSAHTDKICAVKFPNDRLADLTPVFLERTAFNELLAQMPRELAASPQARMLAEASDQAVYNIVQLVYHSPTYEGQSKDYEFSRRTMEDHWRAGYRDAGLTLAHPEVLVPPPLADSPAVFDFTNPTNKRPS